MPLHLPKQPSVSDVRDAVHHWMDLLASERYAEALDVVAHDPKLGWTPELLKDVINGYGLPWSSLGGTVHVVTDRRHAEASETRLYENVDLFDHPLPIRHRIPGFVFIGGAWFDLPLDGKWSDLTASLDIVGAADHSFLELEEIQVC
jgi:hypothetical protein